MDRKLTAILYADVVGYSRLTGADEKGTYESLKVRLGALIEAITSHGGRVVNTAGDAVLAEFASVVTALECAVAAQRDLAERDRDVPEPRKLRFRIGVNLGDVIVDGDEIYGNGVNVAARLETLADAGGVCISGRVLEHVKGNIALGYANLGAQKVKNIEALVNAYKVLLDPEDAGKMIELRKPKAPKWPWPAAAAVALVIVALAGVADWMRPSTVELLPAAKEELAYPLPDTPSIAVLPFNNLSGDPGQEYLAEGITENIITELSRRKALFVIARTSTLPYKDNPVPIAQVSRDLGVRYVLEGSIQRSGEQLRVTAQLIDGLQGSHVWAERYDRELKDLFVVQDDITRAIVSRLGEEVFADLEKRLLERDPETFSEASDYLWRGHAHLRRAVNLVDRDENRKAEAVFNRVLELEPENTVAHYSLGWVNYFDFVYRWSPSREESFRKTREYAERADSLDPHNPQMLWLLNRVYFYSKQYDKAFAAIERAVELNPNNPDLLIYYARRLSWDGRVSEAAEIADKAVRLNPNHPRWYQTHLGFIYNFADRDRDAVTALEKRGNLQSYDYRLLIVSYVRLGDMVKAREYAAKFLETDPDFSVARWAQGAIKAFPLLEKATDMEAYKADLIKAGLPE